MADFAGFSRRYRDRSTGEVFEVNDPALAVETDADPTLESLTLRTPVMFRDKDTGEAFDVTSRDVLDEASADPTLRLADDKEAEEIRKAEAERQAKEIERQTRMEYMREHPVRSAVAAGLQSFAEMGTLGLNKVISKTAADLGLGFGMTAEEQEELEKESPVATGVGTALGFGAGFLGAGVLGGARAAGAAAAEQAAAAGATRLGQAAAAASQVTKTPMLLREALSPSSAVAGRLTASTRAALETVAPGLTNTAVGKGVLGAASGLAAGAAVAPVYELSEAYVDGREFSGESIAANIGLSGLLGGAIDFVPAITRSTVELAGKTKAGQKYASSLGRTRADRLYGAHSEKVFEKSSKQIGQDKTIELANEAMDLGLASPTMNPAVMHERAAKGMEEVGKVIGRISAEADVALGEGVPTAPIFQRIADEVIDPISREKGLIENEQTARYLMDQLETYRERLPKNVTLSDLSAVRTEINNIIYGVKNNMLDPARTTKSDALRDFVGVLTDEIGKGVEQSGINKDIWRRAQRQYQVLAHVDKLAYHSISDVADSLRVNTLTDALGALAAVSTKGLGGVLGKWSAIRSGIRTAQQPVDWARGAVKRALENKAPEQIIKNLDALSRQQADLAAGKIQTLSLRPEDNAQSEFLRAYDKLNSAIEAMRANPERFPKAYVQRAEQARFAMESAYKGLRPPKEPGIARVSGILGPEGKPMPVYEAAPAAPSMEKMGDALEMARDIFSLMSVPSKAAAPTVITKSITARQGDAVMLMRDLRDDFTGLLADNTGMWGEERLKKAEQELRRLYAAYSDPARAARIGQLEEITRKMRQAVEQKSDRLMRVAPGTISKIDPARRQREAFIEEVLSNANSDVPMLTEAEASTP